MRRGEVLEWANETISALETLLLLCILTPPQLTAKDSESRRIEAMFQTAILIDRGRMFFKNKPHGDFGAWKEPAYRGLRPAILDPVVLAHQIACHLASVDDGTRAKLKMIAESTLKRFVSLVQKEVGRSRTASADTGRGGDGIHLDEILRSLESDNPQSLDWPFGSITARPASP